MWLGNANGRISLFEDPKYIFNKWSLIGCFYSNLVEFIDPHRHLTPKRPRFRNGLSGERVVYAQARRNHDQRLEEQFAEPIFEL